MKIPEAQVEATFILEYPFANVHAELAKMAQVDGQSGGLSPITFRWLTSKNRYVNIGLEEVSPSKSEIKANNNSFAVKREELSEIYAAMKAHMDKLKKPLPDLSVKEYKTTSVKGTPTAEAHAKSLGV